MNPKPVFNLFSPKGKAQAGAHRQMPTLAMSLAVLSLFVVTACGPAPFSAPEVEESSPAVALAAGTEMETASVSAFLAANPELLKVHPPADVKEMTESEFLAANPEVSIARRYTGAVENEGSRPATYDKVYVVPHFYFDFQRLKANGTVEENIVGQTGANNVAALRYKFLHGLGIEADIENEATPPSLEELDALLAANPELRFARSRLATAIKEGEDPTVTGFGSTTWGTPEYSPRLARPQ